jgi:CheY-like chemotaxis protein
MTKAKVLLVDDVALFLEIQKGILGSSPIEILTARNGEEALELVRKERPALVCMDLNMPRMDGAACCAAIKTDPELKNIPVIMISSVTQPGDIDKCWAAGCNDFLNKPLDEKLYLEKARKFLPQLIERRSPRVTCRTPVTLTSGTRVIEATSVDLAKQGMFVATDQELPAKSEVVLTFRLPEGSTSQFIVRGQIAWINRGQRKELPSGMGIEFLELKGEGLPMVRNNELKLFIEKHCASK